VLWWYHFETVSPFKGNAKSNQADCGGKKSHIGLMTFSHLRRVQNVTALACTGLSGSNSQEVVFSLTFKLHTVRPPDCGCLRGPLDSSTHVCLPVFIFFNQLFPHKRPMAIISSKIVVGKVLGIHSAKELGTTLDRQDTIVHIVSNASILAKQQRE
jgi:hypothetical protein